MDFIKYLFHYFAPPEPDERPTHLVPKVKIVQKGVPVQQLIPVYSSDGRLLRYIEHSNEATESLEITRANARADDSSSLSQGDIYYKLMPDGNYIPVNPMAVPVSPIKNKPNITNATLVNTEDWDGWPDGNFEQDFSWPEFEKTSNLSVHWAYRVSGGDRRGDEHAESWEKGKRSSRRCLGIIECDNATCNIVVRPQTTPNGIYKQLDGPCNCGAVLKHQKCDVISYLWRWSDGVHYSNGGFHVHRRPTHILHLSGRKAKV